jgi:hypothetical protein
MTPRQIAHAVGYSLLLWAAVILIVVWVVRGTFAILRWVF